MKEIKEVSIEMNFLTLKKMIERQWKVSWELIKNIEDIRCRLKLT